MKNQLELFTMLTVEEEDDRSRTIAKAELDEFDKQDIVRRKVELLMDHGFVRNVDFVDSSKMVDKERKIVFGKWDDGKTDTVTIQTFVGSCNLLHNVCNAQNRIEIREASFDMSDGKINSYSLQNYSSRYIKPSTMLSKIVESNKEAVFTFNRATTRGEVLIETLDKYEKLFPNSKITVNSEWNKSTGDFKVIKISFKNGNWVKLRMGYEFGKEYVYDKFDASYKEMSTVEKVTSLS